MSGSSGYYPIKRIKVAGIPEPLPSDPYITGSTITPTMNPGTYSSVDVDAWGKVISGRQLTFLDITNALGFTPINTNPGEDGGSFVYVQLIPLDHWIISHNLRPFPDINVVDNNNTQIECDITYISATQVSLHFGLPFSGTAYLT